MTSWTEILKANKGLHARDSFSELWGLKLKAARAEFPDYTIAGTLPLSFNSRVAGALNNYRLYGDSDGSGVQTENLAFAWLQNCSIGASGTISANNVYGLAVARVESGQTYAMRVDYDSSISTAIVYAYYTEMPQIGSVSYNESRDSVSAPTQVFTAPITGYIAAWSVYGKDIIVHSATPPTTYIPYGYKIPISLESGVTENLWDENYENISTSLTYKSINVGNGSFTLSTNTPLGTGGCSLFLMPGQQTSGASTAVYGAYEGSPRTVTSVDGYVTLVYRVYDNKDPRDYQTMLTKGSTAPDHYIPHRYESNYDLFIGDSKLGAEEYVDYQEQKVYRCYSELTLKGDEENLYYYGTYEGVQTFYLELPNNVKYIVATDAPHLSCNYYSVTYMASPTVSKTCRYRQTANDSRLVWDLSRIYMFDNDYNNLSDFRTHIAELYNSGTPLKISYLLKDAPVPTDPPVPLPAIQTYQGENTLSSTETVGEVSITGKITEMA